MSAVDELFQDKDLDNLIARVGFNNSKILDQFLKSTTWQYILEKELQIEEFKKIKQVTSVKYQQLEEKLQKILLLSDLEEIEQAKEDLNKALIQLDEETALQTSNTASQTSNAASQTSNAASQASDTDLQASDTDLQASDAGLQTSDTDLHASDADLQTSYAGLQTSDAGLQTSDADFQTSDTSQTQDLTSPTSSATSPSQAGAQQLDGVDYSETQTEEKTSENPEEKYDLGEENDSRYGVSP
ncbi:hypothetical protein [Legionella cincinnatiensis]|uniref:hypothetical protein n=1 Tax=Legionella cincinnatiensis TaxID=28085 RepID=UPI00104188BD|nr:hypothetical protein [Legionella cincinnatiensis]